MSYENRKYVIFPVADLSLIDFSEVMETSLETIRKSVDGTLTFIKWEGDTPPPSYYNLTNKYGPCNYTEMKNILKGPVWTEVINDISKSVNQ